MFSRPNTIIYLRRSSLVIVGRHIAPAKLNIPPELINNLEVLSSGKLIDSYVEFFSSHDVHGKRPLLVLDQSVVFTKTVPLDKSDDITALTDAYVAAMPFRPGQRACVQFRSNNQLQLYATNVELYQTIQEGLREAGGGKLMAITPVAAYQLDDATKFGAAIEFFVNDKEVRRKANFSTAAPL